MKYAAIDIDNKVLATRDFFDELEFTMETEFPGVQWFTRKIPECRGCGVDDLTTYAPERFDHYGITTGHWCESCYNSGKYPYRRDAYDPHNDFGTRDDGMDDELPGTPGFGPIMR